MQLFGKPESVTACAILAETGCDLQSSAVLKFGDGRLACVTASTTAYTGNEALVAGTTGRLRFSESFIQPELLYTRHAPRRGDSQLDAASSTTLKDRLRSSALLRRARSWIPRETREFVPFEGNGYGHEAMEVLRCFQAGLSESPLMTWEDTLAISRINDQVRACWLQNEPGLT